jgi:hypothetical protein
MAQLLLNGLADLADARSHLLRHSEILLSGFRAMCSRHIAKGCSDLKMHRINQLLCDLPGLIEQREVRWVSDIGRYARGVNQKGALVGRCVVRARPWGLITAGQPTVVTITRIILGFSGSNDVQAMTDYPRAD